MDLGAQETGIPRNSVHDGRAAPSRDAGGAGDAGKDEAMSGGSPEHRAGAEYLEVSDVAAEVRFEPDGNARHAPRSRCPLDAGHHDAKLHESGHRGYLRFAD